MFKEAEESHVICCVGQDGVCVLRCPKCDATRKIDATYKDYSLKRFKASCKCGAKIRGRFEFRNYYRKKVHLAGFYHNKKNDVLGNIVIENISLKGIGFSCLQKHSIKKGDQLDITYLSDNTKKSLMTLWVEVVNTPQSGVSGISAVKL